MMKAGPKIPTVEIYVANRTINPAEEITQDAIQLEQWPADRVPEDAARDWQDLQGKFAAQRLFAGEPVLIRKMMTSNDTRSVDIPKGYNVVALRADEVSSMPNLVAPGDRVNVIGFFTRSDVIPETTTKTVLRGIRVFAVDGRTSREEVAKAEKGQSAKTVSLLIHSGDAEVLQWARELARISLTLGRPDEGGTGEDAQGPNPAGQAFMKWLEEHHARQAQLADIKPPKDQQLTNVKAPAQDKPLAPPKPAISHRMVKIGEDGRMSVYTWEEGNPIPTITTTQDEAGDAAPKKANSPAAGVNPLQYLNLDPNSLRSPEPPGEKPLESGGESAVDSESPESNDA
jgi:pilus assembly protein CpaB